MRMAGTFRRWQGSDVAKALPTPNGGRRSIRTTSSGPVAWRRIWAEAGADLVSSAFRVALPSPAARAALEHGRHVLCENPSAMTGAEARELAALADAKRVVNVVNHEFRHFPARETLTRKIGEGA